MRPEHTQQPSARPVAAFTLIEVLAVILMVGAVLGLALDFYVDLSEASTRASEQLRVIRQSTALLDRIAADFERTLLVAKPEETDPLAHPWIFLGESRRSEHGADRVKFVARRSITRRGEGPVSDLEMVAYVLRPSEDGEAYELHRWSAPGLPDGLDREFPDAEHPDSLLLAEGIADFGVRFLSDGGTWTDTWDSSQLLQSGDLPLAVEIEVALAPPPNDPDVVASFYTRQVMLPVRPLNLVELFDPGTYGAPGGAGDDEDEDGELTLADCVDVDALSAGSQGALAGLSPEVLAELQRLQENADTTPFEPYREYLAGNPAVREDCR
jgi:type II secretory pathway pseudopilin PulG